MSGPQALSGRLGNIIKEDRRNSTRAPATCSLSAASRLLLPRTGSDFLARVLVFASVLIAVGLALAASTAVHNRRRAVVTVLG